MISYAWCGKREVRDCFYSNMDCARFSGLVLDCSHNLMCLRFNIIGPDFCLKWASFRSPNTAQAPAILDMP